MYTDQEKNRIAWKEYSKFNVGREVDIEIDGKKEKTIGYVSEIFGRPPEKDMVTSPQDLEARFLGDISGLNGYIVTDKEITPETRPEDVHEVTILFEGSEATNDLTYEDKRFMAALLSVKFMGKIALTKATVDQKSIKKRISSSLTELESSLDQVIGTIDSDLAGKFSNSVKEGVGRKKLELKDLQEFCKTK